MITRRTIFLGAAGGVAAYAAMRFGAATDAAPGQNFEIQKSDEEWRRILSPAQYDVLRREGTERAGTSPLNKEKRKVRSPAPAATCRCSHPIPNTRADRLAELLAAAAECGRHHHRHHVPDEAHRGALPPLRRTSRPFSTMARSRPASATA